MNPRALKLTDFLFWGFTVAYVVLPWITHFFPSQDGPSHVYNGFVALDALFGQAEGGFSEGFVVSWMPVGNWLSAAFLGILETVLPGRIAEKVLLSLYGLLFPLAGRYWIRSFRPDDAWRCLLLFPFAYHRLFLMGFFNFSFALGLMLIAVGYWWRNRNAFTMQKAVVLNLLLIATYFSHVMGTLLAFLALGIMGLATLRERGWGGSIRHGLLLIPCGILPACFIIMLRSHSASDTWSFLQLLSYAGSFGVLRAHHPVHLVMGLGLVILFAIGLIGFFRSGEKRIHRAPLCVGLFLAACFFFLPGFIFNGAFIKERLAIIWPLFFLPALALPFRAQWASRAVTVLAAVLVIGNITYLGIWNRRCDAEVREIDEVAGLVPPGSRAIPLIFNRRGGSADVEFLRYAASYRWGQNQVVDWFNFQAWKHYFPTRFMPAIPYDDLGPMVALEDKVEEFDPVGLIVSIDAFLTWEMPSDSPVRGRILKSYEPHPANEVGRGEVFLRRAD